MLQEIFTHYPLQAPFLRFFIVRRRERTDDFTVVLQLKSNFETRQREAAKQLVDVIEFGALSAQKLPPGRNIVKKVLDTDTGPRLDCIRFRF